MHLDISSTSSEEEEEVEQERGRDKEETVALHSSDRGIKHSRMEYKRRCYLHIREC